RKSTNHSVLINEDKVRRAVKIPCRTGLRPVRIRTGPRPILLFRKVFREIASSVFGRRRPNRNATGRMVGSYPLSYTGNRRPSARENSQKRSNFLSIIAFWKRDAMVDRAQLE